jgi:hypothetical protein
VSQKRRLTVDELFRYFRKLTPEERAVFLAKANKPQGPPTMAEVLELDSNNNNAEKFEASMRLDCDLLHWHRHFKSNRQKNPLGLAAKKVGIHVSKAKRILAAINGSMKGL